ncbi:10103_t:CDS:1 [Acaulospora morrowiae]|uniref:10103_t:CDS:1 n=1 Tax=Acaulospora morrowiae TaxID=94023 RepID=A0A9N8W7S8_9GLOM|nr:10103_t:CDS:1 [Acaulospora morrowiae]
MSNQVAISAISTIVLPLFKRRPSCVTSGTRFFLLAPHIMRDLKTLCIRKSMFSCKNYQYRCYFPDAVGTRTLGLNRFRHLVKKNKISTLSKDDYQHKNLSVTERFKFLTKKYGAPAITIYTIISTLDLGLTFILIQAGGADRVKKVEDWFKETFKGLITLKKEEKTSDKKEVKHDKNLPSKNDGNISRQSPSWTSTFVIAYGIHKLLVPFRLGLTAALTPPAVRKLRQMGWKQI